MNAKFKADYKRIIRKDWSWVGGWLRLLKNHNLRTSYYGRKAVSSGILKKYYRFKMYKIANKYGIEIDYSNIREGIALIHAYNITVNPKAEIGKDATLFKGVTIGSIRSGKKAGVPTIGDRVTFCTNAFVCGNITIGNDVLIAANAYVNFDVPDNSIVIGNPGIIKSKKNPSEDYL